MTKLHAHLPPKWVASTALAFLVLAATTGLVLANLPPSTFEGGDGNLVVDTPGNTDWANVAGLNVGIDQPSGSGDNSFGQGTKEDNSAVSVVSGSVPPNKSDLTRFYEASELVGGKNFLYLAWERTNVLGSANMDFEINQAATAGLGSPGPHTINRTAGDLLITFDFTNGGTKPTLGLLFWVTAGSTGQCFSSNSLPCWGNHIDLTSANSEGAINTVTVVDPIAPNAPRSLAALTFGEASINLTDAGVFPPGVCEAFGSAFLKSRSSASFTAEVKDFVAPVPVNISNCGSITIHKITENGDSTFNYTTTGSLSPSTFSLSNGGTRSYGGVPAGSYSVTESAPPAGWTFKSLVCTASGSGTSTTISAATVSITMGAGGAVDCTYTNHTKKSPTITTALSQSSVGIGTPVTDQATLTGATATAGGTVTYSVYAGANTCTGTDLLNSTVSVTNGSVPVSAAFTPSNAGTYSFQAIYSGDSNNNGATSDCTTEQLVVSKNSPTITTTLSQSSVNIGTPVTDQATLSGATATAGGTVTYSVYAGANTCTGTDLLNSTVNVTNGSVPVSAAFTPSNAGTYSFQAIYSGDSNNNGATSDCTTEQLVVNPNKPAMTTAQNVIPNDAATISGATSTAGGSISFNLYSPADPTCAGAAALTQSVGVSGNGTYNTTNSTFIASDEGTWRWQVVYSGDSNNVGTTSACGVESFTIKNS